MRITKSLALFIGKCTSKLLVIAYQV